MQSISTRRSVDRQRRRLHRGARRLVPREHAFVDAVHPVELVHVDAGTRRTGARAAGSSRPRRESPRRCAGTARSAISMSGPASAFVAGTRAPCPETKTSRSNTVAGDEGSRRGRHDRRRARSGVSACASLRAPAGVEVVKFGHRGARARQGAERAYREYVSDEQRSPAGCIGGRARFLSSAGALGTSAWRRRLHWNSPCRCSHA